MIKVKTKTKNDIEVITITIDGDQFTQLHLWSEKIGLTIECILGFVLKSFLVNGINFKYESSFDITPDNNLQSITQEKDESDFIAGLNNQNITDDDNNDDTELNIDTEIMDDDECF